MCCRLPLALVLLVVCTAYSAPHYGRALGYLKLFGYLGDPDGPENIIENPDESPEVNEGLISFQRMVGVEPSGKLDSETLEWMEHPRCGLPDREWRSGSRRRKRGVSGSKWNTTNLTYRVSQYPKSLPKTQVDQALAEALRLWSNVSPLRFTMVPQGAVHIDVKFVKGVHGTTCHPFDGPDGITSHADYPKYGGNVHFDDDETWTMGPQGTNLRQVAVHEFGHALGLTHSEVNGAAMFPIYVYNPHFKLHPDDIESIQRVYGTVPPPGTGPRTTASPCNCPCDPRYKGAKPSNMESDFEVLMYDPSSDSGSVVEEGTYQPSDSQSSGFDNQENYEAGNHYPHETQLSSLDNNANFEAGNYYPYESQSSNLGHSANVEIGTDFNPFEPFNSKLPSDDYVADQPYQLHTPSNDYSDPIEEGVYQSSDSQQPGYDYSRNLEAGTYESQPSGFDYSAPLEAGTDQPSETQPSSFDYSAPLEAGTYLPPDSQPSAFEYNAPLEAGTDQPSETQPSSFDYSAPLQDGTDQPSESQPPTFDNSEPLKGETDQPSEPQSVSGTRQAGGSCPCTCGPNRPPLPGAPGGRPPVPGVPGGRPPVPGSPGGRPPIPGVPGGRPPFPGSPGGRPPIPGVPGGRPPVPGSPGGRPPFPGVPGGRPPVPGSPGGRPPIPGVPGGRPPVPGSPGGRPPFLGVPGGRPPVPGPPAGRPPAPSIPVPKPISGTVGNVVEDTLAENNEENIYTPYIDFDPKLGLNTEPISESDIFRNRGFEEGASSKGFDDGASNIGYQEGISNVGFEDGASNIGYQEGTSNVGFEDAASNIGYQEGTSNVGFEDGASNIGLQEAPSNIGYEEGTSNVGFEDGASNIGYQEGTGNVGFEDGASNIGIQEAPSNMEFDYGASNIGVQEGFNNNYF